MKTLQRVRDKGEAGRILTDNYNTVSIKHLPALVKGESSYIQTVIPCRLCRILFVWPTEMMLPVTNDISTQQGILILSAYCIIV